MRASKIADLPPLFGPTNTVTGNKFSDVFL